MKASQIGFNPDYSDDAQPLSRFASKAAMPCSSSAPPGAVTVRVHGLRYSRLLPITLSAPYQGGGWQGPAIGPGLCRQALADADSAA